MQPRPRVMIVDDEERLRNRLVRLLKAQGMETACLGDCPEAICLLERDAFDVVLVDVWMQGMDGLETLARIKKSFPAVEVIVLTGHANMDAAVEAMRLGGFDYLLKSCPVEEIILRVESAYEKKVERQRSGRDGGIVSSPGERRAGRRSRRL